MTQFLHAECLSNLDTLISKTEESLTKAHKYFLRNGLLLNEAKTQCIFIGTKQLLSHIPDDIAIHFNDTTISHSYTVKNLGLHMDRYMVFDKHVDEITRKVTGILVYINRVSGQFDKSSRVLVVQALVLSVINYCIKIWGTTNNSQKLRVQKLQNFAARVAVGGLRKFDHVSPAFEELKWLRIKQKHLFDTLVHVFMTIHGNYPTWFSSFPCVNQVTRGSTRQGDKLFVPRHKTDAGAKSMKIMGPKQWNNLPSDVTNTISLKSFKSRLTRYFLST